MNNAVVYFNSNHENYRYIREAERSADAFRPFFPMAKFILYTNDPVYNSAAFDATIYTPFEIPEKLVRTDHKNGQMVAKLKTLAELDFDRILYLGSDTFPIKGSVGGLFDLMDRFDLAAAHAPLRINTLDGNSDIPQIPACYPEFNCDIVCFRNSERVKQFLRDWRDLYLDHAFGHPHDQGAFRYLCYTRDVRIATLPPEYNYRGEGYRSDTVILQNRLMLPAYLGTGGHGRKLTARVLNRLLSIARSPLRVQS